MEVQKVFESLPQIEIEVNHYFATGSYAREMRVPKDVYIVGKIHRHSHINILSYGSCSILTEDGVISISAPYIFTSKPGAKRVLYAESNYVFTTVHATNETDLGKLEDELIAPTFNDLTPEDLVEALK